MPWAICIANYKNPAGGDQSVDPALQDKVQASVMQ